MTQASKSRMTRQRAVILEELRKVDTHPTAEEIYAMVHARMPHISLGTVYRNLELLSSSKLILKLDNVGNTRRYDGNISPHRHVRCLCCGKIGDIFEPLEPEPELRDLQVPGFSIQRVRVEYDGLCDACLTLQQEESA